MQSMLIYLGVWDMPGKKLDPPRLNLRVTYHANHLFCSIRLNAYHLAFEIDLKQPKFTIVLNRGLSQLLGDLEHLNGPKLNRFVI